MERADMTTRIVDVTSAVILPQDQGLQKTTTSSLWLGVLRALSAFEMYRRHVSVQVRSNQVVDYLLKDNKFPRSMKYCLGEMEVALAYLPNAGIPAEAVRRARRRLDALKLANLRPDLLHEYLDQAQKDLAMVHRTIQGTYFAREDTGFDGVPSGLLLNAAQA